MSHTPCGPGGTPRFRLSVSFLEPTAARVPEGYWQHQTEGNSASERTARRNKIGNLDELAWSARGFLFVEALLTLKQQFLQATQLITCNTINYWDMGEGPTGVGLARAVQGDSGLTTKLYPPHARDAIRWRYQPTTMGRRT